MVCLATSLSLSLLVDGGCIGCPASCLVDIRDVVAIHISLTPVVCDIMLPGFVLFLLMLAIRLLSTVS